MRFLQPRIASTMRLEEMLKHGRQSFDATFADGIIRNSTTARNYDIRGKRCLLQVVICNVKVAVPSKREMGLIFPPKRSNI